MIRMRYQERGDVWSLTTYGEGRRWLTATGSPFPQPEWLTTFVTAGRIGGHGLVPANPPPDFILWINLNADKTLHSFGAPSADDL